MCFGNSSIGSGYFFIQKLRFSQLSFCGISIAMHKNAVWLLTALLFACVPIVFMSHADPIGSEHVASLAHPGGNITRLSIMMTETNVKGVEPLKEAVPRLTRLAVIFDPANPSHGLGLKAAELVGASQKLRVQPVAVRSATEFDSAFSSISRERAGAVLVLSTPIFIAGATRLAELALNTNYLQCSVGHITWKPEVS